MVVAIGKTQPFGSESVAGVLTHRLSAKEVFESVELLSEMAQNVSLDSVCKLHMHI